MKTTPWFILLLGIVSPAINQLSAETFKTLHPFATRDGAGAKSPLVLSGSTLYGTALVGGAYGNGTVFKINTDGTGFATLHAFAPPISTSSSGVYTNSDGANPQGGLVLAGSTLYGVTSTGGSSGGGTVFKVNIDGTGFTNLYFFTNPFSPVGLALAGDTLYGTAGGDSSFDGAVFALNIDGTGFTNLHSFVGADGARPNALIVSGDTLYGTTYSGGTNYGGVVFTLKTNGTGFRNLYSFSSRTNAGFPTGRLLLSSNRLYGATLSGGTLNHGGTVFAINTDGTGFTILHTFVQSFEPGTDGDGRMPGGGLALWNDTLYGTASEGGAFGWGTVFAVNIDGSGFTKLHSFSGVSDGNGPIGGLALSGNSLYGTTLVSGPSYNGTVFSIAVTIQLSIVPYDASLILTWPAVPSGFTLQSTTNVLAPVWSTVSPGPILLNGQNVVINPVSGNQQFFRLTQ